MGRRRRRVIRVVKRTLPSVYACPRCGMNAVRVSKKEESTTVTCGSCDLTVTFNEEITKEAIDIYNEFVDNFAAGKI